MKNTRGDLVCPNTTIRINDQQRHQPVHAAHRRKRGRIPGIIYEKKISNEERVHQIRWTFFGENPFSYMFFSIFAQGIEENFASQ